MILSLQGNPTDDLGINAAFADVAVQLAANAGETIGSLAWIQAGEFLKPETTGGHYSEGWQHAILIGNTNKRLLILSNAFSRARCWPSASKRHVGYGIGERPIEQVLPWPADGTEPGGQPIAGLLSYGLDSEHFLAGQLISLAEAHDMTMIDGLKWMGSDLPALSIDSLATIALRLVQDSCVGQMLTWLGVKDGNGLAARPPDRVAARLTWALVRSTEIVGIDGWNEAIAREWIANLARWISGGPSYQTSKQVTTAPQVTLPYYQPVHSYGYMIPAVFRLLLKFGGSLPKDQHDKLGEWMKSSLNYLNAIVGYNGSVPWAIDKIGTYGFMTAGNGDAFTPSYEMVHALEIHGLFEKSATIQSRFAPKLADPLYAPWFADANLNPLVAQI